MAVLPGFLFLRKEHELYLVISSQIKIKQNSYLLMLTNQLKIQGSIEAPPWKSHSFKVIC